MPTFAQNFQIGDVVYGISCSRAPYISSLPGDTTDDAGMHGCESRCSDVLDCERLQRRVIVGHAAVPMTHQHEIASTAGRQPVERP
jgi:hypothetical protein